MEISIDNLQEKVHSDQLENLVRRVIEAGLDELRIHDAGEVSVTFVCNEQIRELNRTYRQKDVATDVLSFPQEEGTEFGFITEIGRVLGDIVISLERAQEQSEEFSHSLEREVGYLAVHGLLHLLGYEHNGGHGAEAMRAREEAIMARVQLTRDHGKG